jgi:hypothetical protein
MNRILGGQRRLWLVVAVIGGAQLACAQEARIVSVALNSQRLTVQWRGPAGWDHFLQGASSLPATQWTDLNIQPSAAEVNLQTLSLAAGQPHGFIRVMCRPSAASRAPRLFFSDLESGPNRGGQDDLGCFITLWGEGFGATRGSSGVTFGGREVARYVEWGSDNSWARQLDFIVVQPGPDIVSGSIEVRVGGRTSNPLSFTVRPGRIFFVGPHGNDANPGDFPSPFRTVAAARDALAPGDIAYLMDGVVQATEENLNAAVVIEQSGEPGRPKALIGYPGARATIGSSQVEYGIRVITGSDPAVNDWIISKLVLRGRVQAMEVGASSANRWRVVGNDISCPEGDGQTGCFAASLTRGIAFLGNHVHDISTAGPQPSKQYHAVYFTTDTSDVEVGWNHIHDNRTCRALQFHSSPLCLPDCGPTDTTGFNQFNLRIHDNLIHGDVCDGINLATVDPARGPVLVYNNVIFDVGRGPSPPDGDANYAGIHIAAGTNNGPEGSGTVEVFHNTIYDCGARKFLPGAIGDEGLVSRAPGSPQLMVRLRNNIFVATRDEEYVAPTTEIVLLQGTRNLWFGAGQPPAFLSENLNLDPLFVEVANHDFQLKPGSPAIDAGIETGTIADFIGNPRPEGKQADLGAFESRSNN